jgi:integrase
MGVKIRERQLKDGEIAFSIDVYHRDYGRFQMNTGLKAFPKIRKEYKNALDRAQDRARQIEKDLLRDPSAVFTQKENAGMDFIRYFQAEADLKGFPIVKNSLRWAKEFTGGSVGFDRINSAWLERYKAFILSRPSVGQTTAGHYLMSIKSILKKAYREGYLQEDVTTRVPGIRKDSVNRHFLTMDQIDALNNAQCRNDMVKYAFLFGCFTGLRLSDVELLTWDQIELVNGAPFIKYRQVKTGRYENQPLAPQAVRILQAAREIQAQYAPEGSEKVFILPSRTRIGKILDIWGVSVGLPWALHFHASRHTFATLVLTFGGDLYTASKLLGHSAIGVTQVYAQIIDAKKVDAVNALPCLSTAEPSQLEQTQSVESKGDQIAQGLRLNKNEDGFYVLPDGSSVTAAMLEMIFSSTRSNT